MGYGYYRSARFDNPLMQMDRGYGVICKCHKRLCKEEIDRGLACLCYNCGWYFCEEHLTSAWCKHDEPIDVECFAGENSQVCFACCKKLESLAECNCDDEE